MRVLMIDNRDSFTFNLVQCLRQLGAEVLVERADRLEIERARSLEPSHVLVSPGPGHPERAGNSMALIESFLGRVPLLGVCLGHQALGAADPTTARLMAAALVQLGVQRAFVVHGTPGWDEATPCGPFLCLDVRDGMVRTQRLDPRDYGLPRCSPSALAGGDIARNTALAEAFLGGELGPIRDAVLLNAALALQVTGRESAPRAALALAAAAVDEGHAARLVSQGRERAQNR